ncbi:threonine--tRNA ligase [Aureibacillus halotolerans]|uniref:Threonine--tRNA ligase n=1 Tax=Aureibacillus halotolerans TaxID=1508390 RepID=A0A4R6U883_9BACI|nr:threonine--tRNA ligase [Aureibacillus halotolerans]TDQ40815.1 threonyl-tRNA synthetase [Aureibacillus halotolerans]
MSKITVFLPDGRSREVDEGATLASIVKQLSSSLKKRAVAGELNGKLVDLSHMVCHNDHIRIVELDSEEGIQVLRHSAAHLLAQAVKRLFGNIPLGVGPVIKDGFYYDMDLPRPLTPDDLVQLQKEMERLAAENLPIQREVVSKAEAKKWFEEVGDQLKLELLKDVPENEEISLYRQGEFVDLCRGPHVPSTSWIKHVQLLHVAGAYWRGNSDNAMLQRVYGTAFPSKIALEEHLHMLEEAKKRDHRKLGKQLELFGFSEDAPGMPLFFPKGMQVRNKLEAFWREAHERAEYVEVKTPIMMNQRVWERSGHWAHYHENMYFSTIDEQAFALKPMSCPGAMLVYNSRRRSYRELPLRYGELGLVHRHEASGALNGLLRVRSFTQDDAHIFLRPAQIKTEIHRIIDLIDAVYKVFGFSYEVELSTRPENSMGSDELWNQSIAALREVLVERGQQFAINEGDGAFYGPKIDFHVSDAIGRSWQCGTIQLDFQMPEKFGCVYINEANEKETPVVLHRVIFGSVERFLAILIEHYAGAFPLWLAPVQVKVLPIADKHVSYAQKVKRMLQEKGCRVEVDERAEKMGLKIREAEQEKVPFMMIVGDDEVSNRNVSLRQRGKKNLGSMTIEEVLGEIGDFRRPNKSEK